VLVEQRYLVDGFTILDLKNALGAGSAINHDALPQDRLTEPSGQDEIHLRLLATSDLHVHIMPYDYYTDTGTDRLGLARTAILIAAARAEAENCLLFDNGDFLQGSPLGDYIAQSQGRRQGRMHPMIEAMNYLRYDAGTLGNHEFNYGLDFLTESLGDATFPIVAANVLRAVDDGPNHTLVPPYVILERTLINARGATQTLKVGVIGFAPPQIMIWDRRHLAGHLTTRDIVDAANTYVPQMKRAGADLIIALSHSGIGSPDASPGMENASTALARIDGIDVVIAGHSHLVFPSDDFARTQDIDPLFGTLCGKPAVMPGLYGSHLGVIDLDLSRDAEGYKVRRHKSEVRPIWRSDADGKGMLLVESHPGVVAIASTAHHETLAWTSQPIGHSDVALHSYFALVSDAPALQLVADAQALFVKGALSSTDFANLPVLTSVAPFKAGGRGGPENYTDVPAGDVMLRHAADLYIYPNTSAAIRLTGGEIADWLEYAVGIFNQIPPGATDAPLIKPDFPSFNFDLIFGLRFQIDLSLPPRYDVRGALINPQSTRIVGLLFEGEPLDPAASFTIATNSYRVSTNTVNMALAEDRALFQSTETNLNVVLSYFAKNRAKASVTPPASRFAAMPGTSVIFDTSPKAIDYVADLTGLMIEPVGPTQTGFLRFRLRL
jgi:2',3'-cyclic-nucleotide 2'-phosphodiesterase / 3'-nucleotidase